MGADHKVKGVEHPRHTAGTQPARRRKSIQVVYATEADRRAAEVIAAKPRAVPTPKPEPMPSRTAEVRRQLVAELKWAWSVVATMPAGRERKWLGGSEPVDQVERVAKVFAPNEVSKAFTLFDLVLGISDPFLRRVVTMRLARVKWDKIRQFDPERRTIRRLQQLHDQALDEILVRLMTASTKPIA